MAFTRHQHTRATIMGACALTERRTKGNPSSMVCRIGDSRHQLITLHMARIGNHVVDSSLEIDGQ